jgi:cytoskeletal protein RodZ
MTLTEVSRATGIWERYLRALEEDESEDALSGQAYARFFLREYAQHLGLDAEPLLRARAARHAPQDEGLEAIEPLPDPRRRARLLGRALAWISIAVLLALAVASQLGSDDETSTPGQGARAASPAASAAAPPPPPSSPAPQVATHVRVVLEATESCWVRAVVDGEAVPDVTLAPGERTVFRADRLVELRLGNAGGADLLANGDPVVTGASGEVVDLRLRLVDGEVVVSRA